MALGGYLQGEVTKDFADGLLSRREALRRLVLLGMAAPAAGALLAACGGDDGDAGADATTSPPPTEAPTTSARPPSTSGAATGQGELIRFPGTNAELQGAWAAPEDPTASVLVIHENRGLTPHFYDLVGRFAADGYAALAVDLLSREGGTASFADPAAAPAALGAAPVDRLLADLRAGLDEQNRRNPGLALAAVGFCFGGGMAWNLLDAGEARLAAVVPFYGPAPQNPDFGDADAAVLGVYAELDDRVNASRAAAEQALAAAGLTYEIRTFPGVDHAFFNDTGPRYDEQAATEAYAAVLDWFDQHLG